MTYGSKCSAVPNKEATNSSVLPLTIEINYQFVRKEGNNI